MMKKKNEKKKKISRLSRADSRDVDRESDKRFAPSNRKIRYAVIYPPKTLARKKLRAAKRYLNLRLREGGADR